jgi:hypothetical protein
MQRSLLLNSLVLSLLTLTPGCTSAIDAETAARFQAAEAAFVQARSEQEFLAVAGQYQQILDSGFRSGAILYNQGNAFLKAKQPGRAIAAYQQAKRYRPNDPLLDSNLRTALSQTVTEQPAPIFSRLLFWQDWISYGGKFACTTVLLMVAVACWFASRVVAWPILGRLGIVAAALTVLAFLSTGYDWYSFEFVRHGVVVVDRIVARKGAAESYDPAFTEALPEGTQFVVTETVADWLHINIGSAGNGWVHQDSVVIY